MTRDLTRFGHSPECRFEPFHEFLEARIEEWRDTYPETGVPVHTWLGLSWAQYEDYMLHPRTDRGFVRCDASCARLARVKDHGRRLAAEHGW